MRDDGAFFRHRAIFAAVGALCAAFAGTIIVASKVAKGGGAAVAIAVWALVLLTVGALAFVIWSVAAPGGPRSKPAPEELRKKWRENRERGKGKKEEPEADGAADPPEGEG